MPAFSFRQYYRTFANTFISCFSISHASRTPPARWFECVPRIPALPNSGTHPQLCRWTARCLDTFNVFMKCYIPIRACLSINQVDRCMQRHTNEVWRTPWRFDRGWSYLWATSYTTIEVLSICLTSDTTFSLYRVHKGPPMCRIPQLWPLWP